MHAAFDVGAGFASCYRFCFRGERTMLKPSATIMIALTLSGAAAAQERKPFEIPRAYWGEYNERAEDCGAENSAGYLRISQTSLRFSESTSNINSMIHHKDGSVTIFASTSGEGEQWLSIFHVALSSDGRSLTLTTPQAEEAEQRSVVRGRC
jgi:hypothetical protein